MSDVYIPKQKTGCWRCWGAPTVILFECVSPLETVQIRKCTGPRCGITYTTVQTSIDSHPGPQQP